jgi:hypothetical protein
MKMVTYGMVVKGRPAIPEFVSKILEKQRTSFRKVGPGSEILRYASDV